MKNIFLILFLIFLFSCNTGVKREDATPSSYLSPAEISRLFKTVKNDVQTKRMDLKSIERKSSIIPKGIFVGSLLQQLPKRQFAGQKLTGKGHIDLRDKDTQIVEQWDSTCTAHGLAAVVENAIGNRIKLSERHIWDAYHVYSCDAAIKAWTNNGCITVNDKWPHGSASPKSDYLRADFCNTFLKKASYWDNDIQSAIDNIDYGRPIYLATEVSNSMYACDIAINPDSGDSGGGHALAIVGYHFDESIKGGGYFIVKNSWGQDCGDKGYQYLPFYHCQRNDLYCLFWSIDEVKVDKSYNPNPVPDKKCVKWRGLWRWKRCVRWE